MGAVTVVKKIKQRPGLCVAALLAVCLIYGGGDSLWRGMTHVGSGVERVGGDVYVPESQGGGVEYSGIPEHLEIISQGEYRRHCYRDGVMLLLFGAGIVWIVVHLWKEKDKKDEIEKS
jgi:hypothetical protein